MDPLGNMLNTLVNAQKVGRPRIAVQHSLFKEQFAKLLQNKGLVAKIRVQADTKPKLIVTLSYDESGQPLIVSASRLSKPGRRSYVRSNKLPHVGNRQGLYIVSTSQGLMDQKEARQKGLGGELICVIWQ